MTAALLLSLFAAVPSQAPLTDTVALIEINHHHDSAGRPIFTQAIYYDWCPATRVA